MKESIILQDSDIIIVHNFFRSNHVFDTTKYVDILRRFLNHLHTLSSHLQHGFEWVKLLHLRTEVIRHQLVKTNKCASSSHSSTTVNKDWWPFEHNSNNYLVIMKMLDFDYLSLTQQVPWPYSQDLTVSGCHLVPSSPSTLWFEAGWLFVPWRHL